MDPDETLKRLRVKVTQAHESNCMDLREAYTLAMEAAELFDALDSWISKGGFLPSDWKGK